MPESVEYEPPREFTPKNVIYYEPTSNEIRTKEGVKKVKPILIKAQKFLLQARIEQIDYTTWLCHPIRGYNKTIHTISSNAEELTCDCQGFRKKEKDYLNGSSNINPICSHILAVKQYCFIELNNGMNDEWKP